jgi:hypothetical protein
VFLAGDHLNITSISVSDTESPVRHGEFSAGDINNAFSGIRAVVSSLEQFEIKKQTIIKLKYLLIFIIPLQF